jgi:hypothetical protein
MAVNLAAYSGIVCLAVSPKNSIHKDFFAQFRTDVQSIHPAQGLVA